MKDEIIAAVCVIALCFALTVVYACLEHNYPGIIVEWNAK